MILKRKNSSKETGDKKSLFKVKRKLKRPVVIGVFLLVAVCGFSAVKALAGGIKVNSQNKKAVNSGTLMDMEVGPYRFTTTGNVNYYTLWKASWDDYGGLAEAETAWLANSSGYTKLPDKTILSYFTLPVGKTSDVTYQNSLKASSYLHSSGADLSLCILY